MLNDPKTIAARLSPAMRTAAVEAVRFFSPGYYCGGKLHGRGYMRRVFAGMATLRAMYRRGLVTRPEPLGHGAGDANRPGKAVLTALGLRVRSELIAAQEEVASC